MTHTQTVFGFFDNAAEAQQAVQHLLGGGVTRTIIELLTLSDLPKSHSELAIKPNTGNGRFLDALFDTPAGDSGRGVVAISVRSQSDEEASQVINLLYEAGAESVCTEE
ncbi:MAG: hypothetical protein EAZ91_24285 [Cytophagales bacterium]|nr:MAG: hypothetical protein EAZ91_24285 [Cytophagales bacterium]